MSDFSSITVLPSWGAHPDDPQEALRAGYWGVPALADDATFVIHRRSDGTVETTETKNKVTDNTAVVVVLGAGQRVLDAAELEALDALVARLRKDKRVTGRLKQTWNGGLAREAEEMAEAELPANLDTTPPEVVVEAQPDPEPPVDEPDDEEPEEPGPAGETRRQTQASRDRAPEAAVEPSERSAEGEAVPDGAPGPSKP